MDWFYAYIHAYDKQIKLKRVPPCDCEARKVHYGLLAHDKTLCDYHFEQKYVDQNTNIAWMSPMFESINASAAWDLAKQYARLAGYMQAWSTHQDVSVWLTREELNWSSVHRRFALLDL